MTAQVNHQIILNAVENKFDTDDLFTNGENYRGKTHQVILRSPLQRIHYHRSKAVTNIRNLTKSFGLSQNTNL